MEEQWKQLKSYEGLYEISDKGNVKRLARCFTCSNGKIYHLKERLLSIKPNKYSGYVNVNLSKDGLKTIHSVHRLVAVNFIENPHNLNIVNHIDENRANNIAENLEWVSHGQNLAHNGAFLKGREKIKRKVFQYTREGELVRTYNYAKEVLEYGFRPGSVTQVCLGLKKSHYGYIWKYH